MRIKEEENSYVVEPDEAKHKGVVKIYRDNATIKLDYEKNQDFYEQFEERLKEGRQLLSLA